MWLSVRCAVQALFLIVDLAFNFLKCSQAAVRKDIVLFFMKYHGLAVKITKTHTCYLSALGLTAAEVW